MKMSPPRALATCAALVALVVAAAGCGSSSSTESDTGSEPSSSTTASETTAELSGSPVRLMVMIDLTGTGGLYQSYLNAYKATVDAVNAEGGVNGRPIKLSVCDSAANANSSVTCARTAVSEKVAGVVSYSSYSSAYEPILAKAGIADIGPVTPSGAASSSPNSFPIIAGGNGGVAGIGTVASNIGCEKAVYLSSFPSALNAVVEELFTGFKKTAEGLGVTVGDLVQAPDGLPDYTSYIANAMDQDADCFAVVATGANEVGLIKAARATAPDVKLITLSGLLIEPESLGSALDGVYVAGLNYTKNAAEGHPAVQQWMDDLEQYDSDPEYSESTAAVWAAVRLFAEAAKKAGKTVDSESVMTALNGLHDYEVGIAPPVSFDEPAPKNVIGPRIFNPVVLIEHYEDGELVLDNDQFVYISSGKPVPGT